MKLFLKAGLLAAVVMTAVSVAPDAHAYAYKDTQPRHWNNPWDERWDNYGPQPRGEVTNRTIPTSELPINRGVGRGSNKPMLDINRGAGMTMTAEPMTAYTPPSDRDRYYGAWPASYAYGYAPGYTPDYGRRYEPRALDRRYDHRDTRVRRAPRG